MSQSFTLQELIATICLGSWRFVWDGKFRTAAAFLDGYDVAAWTLAQPCAPRSEMDWFRAWMAQKFYASDAVARNLVWSGYILHFHPADDQKAFEMLRTLFDEFVSERDHWREIEPFTGQEIASARNTAQHGSVPSGGCALLILAVHRLSGTCPSPDG
jgi:hypothetical protein